MLLFRALLGAALLAGVTTTSQAQTPCGKRAAIVETLQTKYQEVPAAMGIAGQKDLLEIYASPAGTWTILMTMPSGLTCRP